MTADTSLRAWLRPATTDAARSAVRVAWLGRTSTDEQQDPTLSLPRQLTNCRRALPEQMTIVAHFYDVETSRKELDQRGRSTAWTKFDIGIPRDGGIADMLAEASSTSCRFDAVICESIDRIARFTYQGTKIEHDLELAGIPLLAADEPILLDTSDGRRKRKRASQILLRRTKQGVAEWYIVEMLEKSWDGIETHTTLGWNIGKPPYGYLPERHKHPVPGRRDKGRHKTKLTTDPVRGPVVEQIYAWRVDERLSYRAIADRLNPDLGRYPPPQPVDPERAVGRWTASSVREILCNPKYTGHMCWNRRSTKDKLHPGKNNPREEWVISADPTHPAIISTETFLAAQSVGPGRRRSRSDANPAAPNPHRQTKQVYRLRSYIYCVLCDGRRMYGKTSRGNVYYLCQPRDRELPDGHPAGIWLPEPRLLDGLTEFFNAHILGPDRVALAAQAIGVTDARAAEEHERKIDAVRRAIADAESRLARLTTVIEERDDPDGALFAHVQQRIPNLTEQITLRRAELAHLQQTRPSSTPEPVHLLEDLPQLSVDLADLPIEPLRRFLDAFAVQIHYDSRTRCATYRALLSASATPHLAHVAKDRDGAMQGLSPRSVGAGGSVAGCQVLRLETTSPLARGRRRISQPPE